VSEFFASFLADTAATIVGILVGLPMAMWTNRKLAERGDRERRHEQEVRLAHALEAVSHALVHNRERFRFLGGVLAETHATFDPALDYSAWEATHGEVAPLLRDSELQQRLAYHFARVRSLSDLHKDYLNYFIGMQGTLSGAEAARTRLRDVLTDIQSELDADAEQLVLRLEAARARLSTAPLAPEHAPLRRAPAPTGRFRSIDTTAPEILEPDLPRPE
jgi:hypothetical protein